MDKKGWTITWAGIGAALALLATNGEQLLEVATGAFLFLLKLSETAPMSWGSFVLALALGVLSRPFLLRYLPHLPCHVSRDFLIDSSALVIGFAVMFGQLRTLNGALLGLLAGFAAPLVARGIATLWTLRKTS